MGLDRDELAARFAVAIAGGLSADSSVQTYDHGVVIEDAFDLADALIARLRPATVAPVADAAPAPSAATDPRRTVGAVTHPKHDSGLWIVINGDETDCCRRLDGNESGRLGDFFRDDYFVRWATREECERHGIPYVERGAAPSPAASPAAYVPKCGDVVTIFGVTGLASPDWIGSVAIVVHASFGGENVNLRIDYSPAVSWIQRYIDEGRSADTRELTPVGFHLRPATAAERVAAGLDAPAVDREGLAKALRDGKRAWLNSAADQRDGYDAGWDAAIAFLKANGGVA